MPQPAPLGRRRRRGRSACPSLATRFLARRPAPSRAGWPSAIVSSASARRAGHSLRAARLRRDTTSSTNSARVPGRTDVSSPSRAWTSPAWTTPSATGCSSTSTRSLRAADRALASAEPRRIWSALSRVFYSSAWSRLPVAFCTSDFTASLTCTGQRLRYVTRMRRPQFIHDRCLESKLLSLPSVGLNASGL